MITHLPMIGSLRNSGTADLDQTTFLSYAAAGGAQGSVVLLRRESQAGRMLGTVLAVSQLTGNRNAFFQHIHCDVGLLAGHDERRSDADAVRPASQKQDTALKGELDDAITFRSPWRLGFLVGDDLDSDPQAASADVAHQIEPLRPIGDAFHDVFAHYLGILDGFTFEHIHGGQRSRNGDWVPAEGRSVRARNPVHDFRLRHHDAERHPAGDSLGAAEDVRLDTGVLDGPPLAGAPGPRL